MGPSTPRRERGAGLFGAIAGVTVFFALLGFALQLLLTLYATSAVTAAAHDAARSVASGSVDHTDPDAIALAIGTGEARARTMLGRAGDRVRFEWDVDPDRVRLRLEVAHPSLAVGPIAAVFGHQQVTREVTARVERPR